MPPDFYDPNKVKIFFNNKEVKGFTDISLDDFHFKVSLITKLKRFIKNIFRKIYWKKIHRKVY